MVTPAAKLTREDAFTDAIRAADEAIGDEPPTDQALRIIAALKRLRDSVNARVTGTERIDYLRRAQEATQAAWLDQHEPDLIGPAHDAACRIATPLGDLTCRSWRVRWRGGRVAWASEYTLAGEPITISEIRAAGLAQRPTTRNRQKQGRKLGL